MIQRLLTLRGGIPADKLEILAKQVAEASIDAVLERTAPHTGNMSLAEGRGFIRARAAQIVGREALLALRQDDTADLSWKPVIVRRAVERLIPQVLRQAKVGLPRQPLRQAA